MNCIKKYYYKNFSTENIELNGFWKTKLEEIIRDDKYVEFFNKNSIRYYIICDNKLVGVFSFTLNSNSIELLCLYIFKEYRNKSIATYVLNDLISLARHNLNGDTRYILANSFVESSMFFLKKGFDFCKINKKLDYKKKNIIKFYKLI